MKPKSHSLTFRGDAARSVFESLTGTKLPAKPGTAPRVITPADKPLIEPAKRTHTPIPWKIGSGNEVMGDGEGGESFSEWLNIIGVDGKVVCELPGHSQYARGSETSRTEDANAHMIVTAVNNHDALVTECETDLQWIENLLCDIKDGVPLRPERIADGLLHRRRQLLDCIAATKKGQP